MDAKKSSAAKDQLKLIDKRLMEMNARMEKLELHAASPIGKNKLLKGVMVFYPIIIAFLLFMVEVDQHKIVEIGQDIHELISDTQDLVKPLQMP